MCTCQEREGGEGEGAKSIMPFDNWQVLYLLIGCYRAYFITSLPLQSRECNLEKKNVPF